MIEYRDAHITFVCEETGETLRKEIGQSSIMKRLKGFHEDVLEDEHIIKFYLYDLDKLREV